MKRRLMQHIVCPIDRGSLELHAWSSRKLLLDSDARARASRHGIDPAALEEDITTGVLVNSRSRVVYPIHNGVPRLLTFQTGLSEAFLGEHRSRLEKDFAGFALPSGPGAPGERDVLRSFSKEWVGYDWDGKSYWTMTPDAWFRCMHFILGLDDHPIDGRLVLEVGIGVGGVANHNASVEGAEVVGMDLSYSVEPAAKHFGDNPFLHVVQASAFDPPFRANTFDFVYSFGVLHHTYSTESAFRSISALPKTGGHCFVWVYSPYDEERTFVRRLLMRTEGALRPLISRLPDKAQVAALAPLVPAYVAYQHVRAWRRADNIRYGWREAMHAARDRFTPRYIHRHTDAELRSWFSSAGYDGLVCSSERERPDFVPPPFTACAGVAGVRRT